MPAGAVPAAAVGGAGAGGRGDDRAAAGRARGARARGKAPRPRVKREGRWTSRKGGLERARCERRVPRRSRHWGALQGTGRSAEGREAQTVAELVFKGSRPGTVAYCAAGRARPGEGKRGGLTSHGLMSAGAAGDPNSPSTPVRQALVLHYSLAAAFIPCGRRCLLGSALG